MVLDELRATGETVSDAISYAAVRKKIFLGKGVSALRTVRFSPVRHSSHCHRSVASLGEV